MGDNIVKTKSFEFAIRVVKLFRYLQEEKKEYILSKQLLRSGTAVGALIRESEYGESRLDFIHKLSIGQKEINETIYWLELLNATNYIDQKQFESLNNDAVEIIKLLTSILKNTKSKLKIHT